MLNLTVCIKQTCSPTEASKIGSAELTTMNKRDLHVYLRVDQTGQSLALEQLLARIVSASIAASSCALVLRPVAAAGLLYLVHELLLCACT